MTIVNLESLNREAFEVIKPRSDPPLLKGPYTLRQGMWAWKYAPANVADAAGIDATPLQPVQGNEGALKAAGQTVIKMGNKAMQIGTNLVGALAGTGTGAGAGTGADDKTKGAADDKAKNAEMREQAIKLGELEAQMVDLERQRAKSAADGKKAYAEHVGRQMDALEDRMDTIRTRLAELEFGT
jgi:hypothetical protein